MSITICQNMNLQNNMSNIDIILFDLYIELHKCIILNEIVFDISIVI